ncbi:hypothetical protein PANA5342_2310 [Pantoea ananatis LMG 5342]|nr:hypothetical protein PANA5342_2310 [Pantoea ananatis LMG 5342]
MTWRLSLKAARPWGGLSRDLPQHRRLAQTHRYSSPVLPLSRRGQA